MQELTFYQNHLNQVSRSFAMCIPKLAAPYRQWISLSYLLCRVLDTIEDSPWRSDKAREEQFYRFNDFMNSPPSKNESLRWASNFPSQIVEAEQLLLKESCYLFQDLQELPKEVRGIIQIALSKMNQGMCFYSRRTENGMLRLSDITDINRYCYFVAGVVGELLSHLFMIYRPDFHPDPSFRTNGLHFGLFLQKVNLLKDQISDEKEGRYLVPNRNALLSSLRINALGGLQYLLSLPQDEVGYRTFCGWSLFLGVASLPWITQAFESKHQTKIPRALTQTLLTSLEGIIQDNEALMKGFEEFLSFLPEGECHSVASCAPGSSANSRDDGSWFLGLTRGTLGMTEMTQLGMI
jgi:phytoene/squalene synthetase